MQNKSLQQCSTNKVKIVSRATGWHFGNYTCMNITNRKKIQHKIYQQMYEFGK